MAITYEGKVAQDERTPLLYPGYYTPPPQPLSPEDIRQRRRSLGIASVLSIDARSSSITPGCYTSSGAVSVKSSQTHIYIYGEQDSQE
ncbi:hypothetical protein GGF46_003966, partial [Coemansia sp. RSA 552]